MKRKVNMAEGIEGLLGVLLGCVHGVIDSRELRGLFGKVNIPELIVFNWFIVDFITQTSLKDPIPFLDAFSFKLYEAILLEFGNPVAGKA